MCFILPSVASPPKASIDRTRTKEEKYQHFYSVADSNKRTTRGAFFQASLSSASPLIGPSNIVTRICGKLTRLLPLLRKSTRKTSSAHHYQHYHHQQQQPSPSHPRPARRVTSPPPPKPPAPPARTSGGVAGLSSATCPQTL